MLRVLLVALVLVFSPPPSLAQSIVREMKDKTPKCMVILLDVSESMKVDDYNHKMHDAVEQLLIEGLQEGDRAVLYTFGSGFRKIFDDTPATPAARRKLVDLVPIHTEPGEGTNIRQPHHEGLKLAKESGKIPYIVILTDSFNDPPKNTPAAYTQYQKYYTPGKLEVYPATPENRDYEQLLSWMGTSSGKTFGIGVEIQSNNRPKERFKVAPKGEASATPEPVATPAPRAAAPLKDDGFPLGLIATLIAVLAGGAGFAFLRPRPMPLRITGGAGGARDFDVRGNTALRLGGEGAAAALDAYPLAGIKESVATIRGGRAQLTLQPQPTSGARVYHNGLPLEKPTPLRYGDEVRITILDTNGAVLKENRLKFSDPTKTF